MSDEDKTNEQLINELNDMRQRMADLKRAVADHERVQETLRQSQDRYRRAVKAGKVGIWDWNLTTNDIYLDANLKAMLGYADHEIQNLLDDWGEHVHPADRERVMVEANAHLEGLTPQYEVEHRMLHKDGSCRWFLARGTAIRDAGGKPDRMIGTDTDITERKWLEEELRRYQNQLEKLVKIRTAELQASNEQLQAEMIERQHLEAGREKLIEDLDAFWGRERSRPGKYL